MNQNEFTPPNEGEIIAVMRCRNYRSVLFSILDYPSQYIVIFLIGIYPIFALIINARYPDSDLWVYTTIFGPFLCYSITVLLLYLHYRYLSKSYQYVIFRNRKLIIQGSPIDKDWLDLFKFEISIKENMITLPLPQLDFKLDWIIIFGGEYILIEKYRGKNARELMKFLTENLKKPEVNEDELNLFVWP